MLAHFSFTAALLHLAAAQESWLNLAGNLYSHNSLQPWGTSQDASWPVTSNVGAPLQPQVPDAELIEMLAEIDPVRIQSIVQTLTNFGTRHTLSNQTDPVRGIGAARDWIYAQMLELAQPSNGAMEVYFNSYIQPIASRISFPVNITNVVAQINGTSDPNRVYVITGHYDSRRLDVMDYVNDAPGSDDNATGVAVLMELIRIIATRRPKATMIFAATAGEEQDTYGATNLANTLKAQAYNVEGNWNNDSTHRLQLRSMTSP